MKAYQCLYFLDILKRKYFHIRYRILIRRIRSDIVYISRVAIGWRNAAVVGRGDIVATIRRVPDIWTTAQRRVGRAKLKSIYDDEPIIDTAGPRQQV